MKNILKFTSIWDEKLQNILLSIQNSLLKKRLHCLYLLFEKFVYFSLIAFTATWILIEETNIRIFYKYRCEITPRLENPGEYHYILHIGDILDYHGIEWQFSDCRILENTFLSRLNRYYHIMYFKSEEDMMAFKILFPEIS